jgi:Rrf2 family protein
MKLITRNTDYALRVLLRMAKDRKKIFTADSLIEELKIPGAFLRRLLQALGARGILRSYKGKNGGFALTSPPEKTRVLDVMRVFQGSIGVTDCLFKKKICPNRGQCPLRKKVNAIERKVIADFRAITIASLLKGSS